MTVHHISVSKMDPCCLYGKGSVCMTFKRPTPKRSYKQAEMCKQNDITMLKCYSSSHEHVNGHCVCWRLGLGFWDDCLGSHPGHTRVRRIVSIPFIVPVHNHPGSGLLPAHRPISPRYSDLLWLNVFLADNWWWKHEEPYYVPYDEPNLFIVLQRHTWSFLLDTKPFIVALGEMKEWALAMT